VRAERGKRKIEISDRKRGTHIDRDREIDGKTEGQPERERRKSKRKVRQN